MNRIFTHIETGVGDIYERDFEVDIEWESCSEERRLFTRCDVKKRLTERIQSASVLYVLIIPIVPVIYKIQSASVSFISQNGYSRFLYIAASEYSTSQQRNKNEFLI